jgi:hypothetical protein
MPSGPRSPKVTAVPLQAEERIGQQLAPQSARFILASDFQVRSASVRSGQVRSGLLLGRSLGP